jgi:hypothetical protein
MSRLGIERTTGLVCAGPNYACYPVWPLPILSSTKLIESPQDFQSIPINDDAAAHGWLFYEYSFDPVSRIRRGRLFQHLGNSDSQDSLVEVHPVIASEARGPTQLRKTVNPFIECTDLLNIPNRGEGLQLAIGMAGAYSLWRIVQTEKLISNDVMVTLRAESAFDILPSLDTSKMTPHSVPLIKKALERVLDAAYKELPTSVVDQCRNAATVVVSHWLQQLQGTLQATYDDLGKCVNAVQSHFKSPEQPRHLLCSALEIINKLHPRVKDNEARRMDLRPVSDADAELSVRVLGFVIREVGWALI